MIYKEMATRNNSKNPPKPVIRPPIIPADWSHRIKADDPGNNEIRIVLPDRIYRGKTYSDLISDWFNWLLTTDPDKHNSASVAFLRAVDIPLSGVDTEDSKKQDGTSESNVSDAYADDVYFPRKYPNNPNVMIGGDRLQIYSDQAVFVPIIVAYAESSKPYIDWGLMQEYNGTTIDNGDNPPKKDQLTINGAPVILDNMEQFRVSTPIFTAVVPETDYGRSAKDFLEMNFPPGQYPVMVEGYFVLIRFGAGRYQLHSRARAGRETHGPYFAELLYEIEVFDRNNPAVRPARNDTLIAKVVQDKIKTGELEWRIGEEMGDKIKVRILKPT